VVLCAYSLMSGLENRGHEKELRQALIELGELEPDRPK